METDRDGVCRFGNEKGRDRYMVRYSGFGRDVFFLGRVYAQVKRVEPELIELGIVPEISEERGTERGDKFDDGVSIYLNIQIDRVAQVDDLVHWVDIGRVQRVKFTRFEVAFNEITVHLTHDILGKFLYRHTGEEREEQEGKDSIFHVITSLFEVKHMG